MSSDALRRRCVLMTVRCDNEVEGMEVRSSIAMIDTSDILNPVLVEKKSSERLALITRLACKILAPVIIGCHARSSFEPAMKISLRSSSLVH